MAVGVPVRVLVIDRLAELDLVLEGVAVRVDVEIRVDVFEWMSLDVEVIADVIAIVDMLPDIFRRAAETVVLIVKAADWRRSLSVLALTLTIPVIEQDSVLTLAVDP